MLMATHQFDDQNIKWGTLAGFHHFSYFVYDVDVWDEDDRDFIPF
jgi:hypothetical protein